MLFREGVVAQGLLDSDFSKLGRLGEAQAAQLLDHSDGLLARRYWTWFSSICQPWPGHDPDRYTRPWTAQTVNPVLVVGNRFDPATPYQGAVSLARILPRSRLLTLNGWGHTSEGKSSCIDAHTARYLLTTPVPQPGTVCQPALVPFAHPSTPTAGSPTQPARS